MDNDVLARWRAEGRLVAICPELAGGLGVPRPPSEIIGDGGGLAVLQGAARVEDPQGHDVTPAFVTGAEAALALVRAHGIRVAVLTDRSPSCGITTIHDGTFGSGMRPGLMGVTAALLHRHGVALFTQHQMAEADRLLRELEQAPA